MARRGPEPAVVTLTKRQRGELEVVVADETARPRLRQRAEIVLAAADGASNSEIAVMVGVVENTVSMWRARFAEGGVAALADRPHLVGPGQRAGRPLTAIIVTADQREVLQRWCRRPNTAAGLAMRARIVLAAADGLANTEVAALVGCDPATVTKWRTRFLADGLVAEVPYTACRYSLRSTPHISISKSSS